jgi:AcrR family transcriptional regulator
MASASRRSKSAADWANAGFDAFNEGGLDAVAVERVAQRLGATKGSFYWHFKDREALVRAVLDLWRAETEEIIDEIGVIEDPRGRLRRLFELVTSQLPTDRSEVDLLGRSGQPVVAAVLEDVSRRRIDFMATAMREAGLRPAAAEDAAVQAYALWIGLLQLQSKLPGTLPTGSARQRFLRSTRALLDQLVPGP